MFGGEKEHFLLSATKSINTMCG